MLGGLETLIYAFRLEGAPKPLSGPLVLRLFSEPGGEHHAAREAVVQNAVADTGYPCPRVVMPGGQRRIIGRAFNIMEKVSGRPLLDALLGGTRSPGDVAGVLARTHAGLHAVPSEWVEKSLRQAGIPMEQSRLDGRLRYLDGYAREPALSFLGPAVEWLVENRPSEGGHLSICHGDFHPGNVIVDGGTVTGVIDWAGAVVAEAEHDIATSMVLIAIGGPLLDEKSPVAMFEAFAHAYLEAYSRYRCVDSSRLGYYRAFRLVRAYSRACALRTPRIPAALRPREGYPWVSDRALRLLQRLIAEGTGVEIDIPAGVGRKEP